MPLLLVAAVLGGWLGVSALTARSHLEQARVSLAEARQALLERRGGDAAAAIGLAGQDTARARSLTDDVVWRAAGALPVLGDAPRAVRSLTVAADEVARGVLPPALAAAEALTSGGLRTPSGAIDLELVEAAAPRVEESASRLGAARASLAAAPGGVVPSPLRSARAELLAELDEVATALAAARQAVALAPPLLGGDRLRRYFVMVQQPGESRGTGGLIGGYAVLEAEDGRIRVTDSGSNADLENGDIPVPPGVSEQFAYEYGGNLGFRLWQNVNLSPDLPMVARVVEARWRAQGGKDLDGVIALDPVALADLLRGSAPLDVGGGRRVAPEDLVRYLTVDQYAGVPAGGDQSDRKDALAQSADLAAVRLTSGSGDLDQLLQGLSAAVGNGHLRMASDDPLLQPRLAAVGVDGALPQGDGPVAYAVVQNGTQGKLDSFLDRRVTYTAGPCVGDARHSSISVQLTNDAPASGLPPYLTIFSADADRPTTSSTDSGVLLQTYGTKGALLQSAELNGKPVPLPDATAGERLYEGLEGDRPFWSLYVDLPRGRPQTLTLRLREPVVAGAAQVPEQPLVRPLVRAVDVPSCP